VHRDLKPSNILIHNNEIKLGDFGFCKILGNPQMTTTMVGSPIYMAPEILKGHSYDVRCDIWSLGVNLYELLFGTCPYEERTINKLINLLTTGTLVFHRHINNISKQTENLLRRILV